LTILTFHYSDLRLHWNALNCNMDGVMVLNATFNNISVISWRSVLMGEETGVPGKNHRPVASH
jgi:hypothetical protein